MCIRRLDVDWNGMWVCCINFSVDVIIVCACACMCILCTDDLIKLLNDFYKRPEVKRLAAENGLDGKTQFNSLCISCF